MALLKCGDCGRDVSSKATACPHCGAPVPATGAVGVVMADERKVRTIQETSKHLKVHILIAAALFWGGVLVFIIAANSSSLHSVLVPTFAMLASIVGLIWYIATKARIWWHHK